MSKIIDIPDDEEDDEETIDSKQFIVLVKKIERYAIDSKVSFNDIDANITDLFDLTLKSKSKQFKCVLHPKLNIRVHRKLIDVNSMIKVTDYQVQCDETKITNEYFVVVKDFTVLEFQNTGKFSVDKTSYRLCTTKKELPITSARSYYLPVFNDVDYYGDNWHVTPLPTTMLSDQTCLKTIEQLSRSNPGTYLNKPTHGTVVTKSRLKHFSKSDDKQVKCPYTFTIEIEHDGWTCSVSLWNTVCTAYFVNINVGDHILLKNYRVKKRYGTRSNTVYCGRDSMIELSINSCNPKGEIELLEDGGCDVQYRFKTFKDLHSSPLPRDVIIDVVGIVTFVGRVEREKNIKSSGLNCQDYWMYRWLVLKDDSSGIDLKVRLYACSQPEVLDTLEVGEVLVATRVLYKSLYKENGAELCYCVTSSRETQLYRLRKSWKINDVENFPFKTCIEFLDLLKLMKHNPSTYKKMTRDSRYHGYFTYPQLPTTLQSFQKIYNNAHHDAPMEILASEKLVELTNAMYAHQSVIGVCVQATISAVEIIDETSWTDESHPTPSKRRKSNRSGKSQSNSEVEEKHEQVAIKVFDERSVLKSDDMLSVGGLDMSTERIEQLLGVSSPFTAKRTTKTTQKRKFIRFLLTGLNKNVAILAIFIPTTSDKVKETPNFTDLLRGVEAPVDVLDRTDEFLESLDVPKHNQKFLFVFDLHYFGNEVLNVVVNRGYQI